MKNRSRKSKHAAHKPDWNSAGVFDGNPRADGKDPGAVIVYLHLGHKEGSRQGGSIVCRAFPEAGSRIRGVPIDPVPQTKDETRKGITAVQGGTQKKKQHMLSGEE